MQPKLDEINRAILRSMQENPEQTQRELAAQVGLSQNACWRRIKQMEAEGIIQGTKLVLNREKLGANLVVFTMVRTRNHSSKWLDKFRNRVMSLKEVVDFYRIGGDYDYMLKIATRDMASYDLVYQQLIDDLELDTVTSYFAMEAILDDRALWV
ncbi:MAG: Lrp/AsnC family transcriptional regulator [Stappiaceae bacterium]